MLLVVLPEAPEDLPLHESLFVPETVHERALFTFQ